MHCTSNMSVLVRTFFLENFAPVFVSIYDVYLFCINFNMFDVSLFYHFLRVRRMMKQEKVKAPSLIRLF